MSETGQPGDGRRLPWSPITPADQNPPSSSSPSQGTPPTGPAQPTQRPAQPPTRPPTADGTSEPAGPGAEIASADRDRPRWLLPVAIIGGLLLVAGVIAGVIAANSEDEPAAAPLPAETIVVPSPSPTVEPVAREVTTAFATALPATVLQYALVSSAIDANWVDAGALEAYLESYADGSGGAFTVHAGQWETPEDAAAFYAARVAELPVMQPADATGTEGAETPVPGKTEPVPARDALPQAGDVRVDGEKVGTYTVVDKGDGTGVAVWRNATTVFHAEGPAQDVLNFYRAFPM
jgi:hypothetical protein